MKNRAFYKRAFIWLLRFRHRKGYGVHSPFAFRLITEVIYADDPYYDYDALKDSVQKIRTESTANWEKYLDRFSINELLYRLVNEVEAKTILEIGSSNGVSSIYLSTCRKSAKHIVLDKKSEKNELIRSTLSNLEPTNIDFRVGDVIPLTSVVLAELQTVDFLLLRPADFSLEDIQSIFEECIAKSNEGSLFVIQDIYASRMITRWWKERIKDQRLGITFDLYDMGLVFFDKTKIKQHYIVNF